MYYGSDWSIYTWELQAIVAFKDGIKGIIDWSLVNKEIFKILHDDELFRGVYTTGYSIAYGLMILR